MAKGIYFGNQEIADIPGIAEVWAPSPTTGDLVKVYPSRQAVKITGTAANQSRDQFRDALTASGLDYETVEYLPFDLDTSESTNLLYMFDGCSQLVTVPSMDTRNVRTAAYMFRGCTSLTHVPDMDTSQVTDMGYMFRECVSLTHAPALDTSQVTTMGFMFRECVSLAYVPDMDTSQVTNMYSMFRNCSSLTDGNVRLIGRHPDVNVSSMITGSGLTSEPFYDT